jgi:hypothetical protein
VRASWLPADIARVVADLTTATRGDARSARALACRAAVGAGHIRIEGDVDGQARAIEALRASAAFGNVVIARGSPALKARVDVWGAHGDRQPLFDALKRAFDPSNVLNAGRGPL